MKYKNIKRNSVTYLNTIIANSNFNKTDKIKSIIKFYIPQINELIIDNIDKYKVSEDNIIIDIISNTYNKRSHYLAVNIRTELFRFNLEEQFNNCGILVSTDTNVNLAKKGVGTLLHAIKEDIAYVFNYSAMMYTDRYNEIYKSFNNKIFEDVGLIKIYSIINKRNHGMIAVWINDITTKYQQMFEQEQLELETIKQEELTLEELT